MFLTSQIQKGFGFLKKHALVGRSPAFCYEKELVLVAWYSVNIDLGR